MIHNPSPIVVGSEHAKARPHDYYIDPDYSPERDFHSAILSSLTLAISSFTIFSNFGTSSSSGMVGHGGLQRQGIVVKIG